VLSSVNLLQLTRGTNIGDGLRVSLEAITRPGATEEGPPLNVIERPRPATAPPANPAAATIILLSDGASTTGPDPLAIAASIAAAGVKTHAVGIGARGGVFGGPAMRMDEDALRGIAGLTGGEYFSAGDAAELRGIYAQIAKEHQLVEKATDVTFIFGGAALLLLLGGLGLGAVWQNRLP
jgi:Ca-activated chloride channel family protein